MSDVSVDLLFDEWATRYMRGERPDVNEYLELAGVDRDAMGGLIERFLEAAPAREPSEEEIVLAQAALGQEPPLVVLRLRRQLGRSAIVEAIVSALGIDPAKSDRVAGYYHELEVGTLDPGRVDRRVWDVLAESLMANVRLLAGLRPEPPAGRAVSVFHRSIELREVSALAIDDAVDEGERERKAPDEVDRLFRGDDT